MALEASAADAPGVLTAAATPPPSPSSAPRLPSPSARPKPQRRNARPQQKRGKGKKQSETKPPADAVAAAAAAAVAVTQAAPSPLEKAVEAVRLGREDDLLAILRAPTPPDVNKRTSSGDALLVEACRYARAGTVELLLRDFGANVNVTSVNKAMNRSGLSPLVAACMALDAQSVELILQQPHVKLLQPFGRVNAALVCILFCEPNGRSEAQNEKAIAILERLLEHAHKTDQLADLLAAKVDKVNTLVHVAAALANWRVLRLLQDNQQRYGADLLARNARGDSLLHVVELNAFQARSLQFCEPPRAGDTPKKRDRWRQQRRSKRGGDNEAKAEANTLPEVQEPESEADRQTFTRSRPHRSVEAEHVTKTVLELAKATGVSALFSRKGDGGVRAVFIKSLVLAEIGVIPIANEIAALPQDSPEKQVFLDGLMYNVVGLHSFSIKNPKEYRALWQRAVTSKVANESSSVALSPAAFKLITDALLSHRSVSRRLKVWSMILIHSLDPYAHSSGPLSSDERPALAQCTDVDYFRRINEMLYRSGGKLLFCIFDRTDIEEDESYDEEIEFHLLIALFEHFLQLFVPYARTIRDADTEKPLGALESFRRSIAPVKKLWPLVLAGLDNLDESIASPQRFSLILHILQVFEQLEMSFQSDEERTLTKLFTILKPFVKKEANKKRIEEYVSIQVRLLQTISREFPLPPTFVERLLPLKDKLDVLLRSDPKILGVDLYALAAIDDLVRLEHKVDYLGVLSEEHSSSVSVSISRASGANYVDFILQQILSATGNNLKGELNVTLINEPGVGVGVVREFFQIVQSCFFNPTYSTAPDDGQLESKPLQHVSEIGTHWLELARTQASPANRNRNRSKRKASPTKNASHGDGDITRFFPLFTHADTEAKRSDELRVATRLPVISKARLDEKRSLGELFVTQTDLVADAARVDALKKLYLCAGRLIGLAIRNHQPLDASFPLALWKFMFHEKLTWEDYCGDNEVFKRSLQFVLDHDFDTEPLDLQFEYTTELAVLDTTSSGGNGNGKANTVTMEMELQPGKGREKVTNANKAAYVQLRAQRFFFGHELEYYKKLRDGLMDTIRKVDLQLFQPAELRRVVCGERLIDFSSLRTSVVYSRGASPTHGVIKRFWDVVESFDQPARGKLLTFWSGSPLPPVFGFESKYRSMNADTACWYIDVDSRMKTSLCPMANTCDRRLILPDYSTTDLLKEKLLVAIEYGAVGYDRM